MSKALSIYNVCFVLLQADYAFVLIQRYLQIQVGNKQGRYKMNLHETEIRRSATSQVRQNWVTDAPEQCLSHQRFLKIAWLNHDNRNTEPL